MKELLDIIFPTLSDELIIVISLIIGLLVTASLILFLSENCIRCWDSERQIAEHYSGEYWPFPFNITLLTLPGMEHSSSSFR